MINSSLWRSDFEIFVYTTVADDSSTQETQGIYKDVVFHRQYDINEIRSFLDFTHRVFVELHVAVDARFIVNPAVHCIALSFFSNGPILLKDTANETVAKITKKTGKQRHEHVSQTFTSS